MAIIRKDIIKTNSFWSGANKFEHDFPGLNNLFYENDETHQKIDVPKN